MEAATPRKAKTRRPTPPAELTAELSPTCDSAYTCTLG
jgi:hypothetical protein